jgi:hypothetical protein
MYKEKHFLASYFNLLTDLSVWYSILPLIFYYFCYKFNVIRFGLCFLFLYCNFCKLQYNIFGNF